jgi:hypothetical protein
MRANGVRSFVSCWQSCHQPVLSADGGLMKFLRQHSGRSCVHGLRHLRCRFAAELEGATGAGEPDRRAMAALTAERPRALIARNEPAPRFRTHAPGKRRRLLLMFIRVLAERLCQFLKFDGLREMPHCGRTNHVRRIAVAHLPSDFETEFGLVAMVAGCHHSGISRGGFLFF